MSSPLPDHVYITYRYPVSQLTDVIIAMISDKVNGSVTINFVSGIPGGMVEVRRPYNPETSRNLNNLFAVDTDQPGTVQS